MSLPVRCAQCQLPMRGRPLTLRIGAQREAFCCYGCYLVLRLTRERGPGGEAQAVAIRLGLALFFAMNAMMFSLPGYFPYVYGGSDPDSAAFLTWLRVAAMLLTLPVVLLLGGPVLWQALRDLARLIVRTDALVALGSLAAYAVSVHHTVAGGAHVYFDTVALLLVFVALGRYLEARAKADTGRVLTQLRAQVAPVARVLRDGRLASIPTTAVGIGDVLVLEPGDVCPSDGAVVWGQAHFDESTLTGESRPVSKARDATVLAGSTNLDGRVHVRATGVGNESSLGRLTQRVEEALADRAGFQRFADRLASVLVILVPVLAALTFVYWSRQGAPERALLAALAVLVVACPCAFGIATPAALWVGVSVAANRGVLVRSAAVLEALSRVRTVWFDKTGTLSSGRLVLTALIRAPDAPLSSAALLRVAGALERGIPHPIATALASSERDPAPDPPAATAVRYRAGLGVEADIDGRRWYLGSPTFLAQQGVAFPPWSYAALRSSGTGLLAALGSAPEHGSGAELRAMLHFNDDPRPEAAGVLRRLREAGLEVGILTGAVGIGDEWRPVLGGTVCHTGLSPDGKVARLRAGRRGGIAMVGDGLNDAPALAAADVGIALGTGKDLTREAAQVNVLSSDLNAVPWIIAWSRDVRRTVMQNMSWALFYNTVALGAAVSGRLNPVIAAVAMVASSVLIVTNAQRLRRRADSQRVPLGARDEAALPHPLPLPS